MSRVRVRGTKPELMVRTLLFERGVRYRLNRKDLPGKPDIYIARIRLAIFVNGCFWHGHDCSRGRRPATNQMFWNEKIERNQVRDAAVLRSLSDLGFNTVTIWQCTIRQCHTLIDNVAALYFDSQVRRRISLAATHISTRGRHHPSAKANT
jgi:DNA mismatch endonuclease (patch repair protein)